MAEMRAIMKENRESPERRRERMRLEELKRNARGNMNDAFNRDKAVAP